MSKKFTLYDYLELTKEGEQITVIDANYDIETYFYKHETENNLKLWNESIKKLSQLLTVKEIYSHAVAVDLSDIIEKKLLALEKANLFNYCDIDSIMEDIDKILAGNVSEKWLEKFVNILSE